MTGRTTLGWVTLTALVLWGLAGGRSWAQSSSLFLEQPEQTAPATAPSGGGRLDRSSPSAAGVSLVAVLPPEPRRFSVHDLVTIIVRESTEADAQASLDSEKQVDLDGNISAFPKLKLSDLMDFRLTPSDLSSGQPAVGITFDREFEGDGNYKRRDTFTARITARVIDIKPNGTLVLEARKYIKTDSESLDMVLTGTCRKEDITADNTLLSTQIYDLRLTKNHSGELHKATKKGLLTKVFELIFSF